MSVLVGINGFGRIGRSVFRILSERDDVQVVGVNDLYDNEQLAYLLKYDTVMGVFVEEVSVDDDAMYVGTETVKMTAERDPADVPWGDLGADVVVEVSEEMLRRHGLTFDEVAGAVRRSSLDLPGGSINTARGEILLRTLGQAYRGPEFE